MNYKYWESRYPDCCVVKKEGFYYTARGRSAETLNEILGYKLYESGKSVAAGGTSLEKITEALRHNRVNYVVIENDKVVDLQYLDEYPVENRIQETAITGAVAEYQDAVFPAEDYPDAIRNQAIVNSNDPEYEAFKTRYGIRLNGQQDAAVKAVDGPVLLLAVPGSGKTTVLVARLGYMIYVKGISPRNILTVTYTVAATNDMKNRFAAVFGEEYADALEFRTINGICHKILGYYGRLMDKTPFAVADKQATDIIKVVFKDINGDFATENDIKNITVAISYVKNMMLSQNEIEHLEVEVENFTDIYREYNRQLNTRGLIDYDDQMIYALRILEKCPAVLEHFQDTYRYICVDEAQDTSKIQHVIINLLASKYDNLFMVGDEDQSIYGFRAAYPQGLLDFEKQHKNAKILLMESNYRSNDEIVKTAGRFIQKNRFRHAKSMNSTRPAGGCVKEISLNERRNQYNYLVKVAQDCTVLTAVLYRNNESAIPLIDLLERSHIPYRLKKSDMVYFSHPVVKDITDILRYSLNQADREIFMRIYYKIGASIRKVYAHQMVNLSCGYKPILQMAQDISEIPFYIKKSCREAGMTLKNIATATAGVAVYSILHVLGYDNYIVQHNMDMRKADVLQMLANNCGTVREFLDRLSELQQTIENGTGDHKSNFVLSTIHSSKGLEYDRVYLMDMTEGIIPSGGKPGRKATHSEAVLYEEERRLFYVAMTRAKNELYVFTFKKDESSTFCKEIFAPIVTTTVKVTNEQKRGRPADKPNKGLTNRLTNSFKNVFSEEETRSKMENFEMGVLVRHRLYGKGVISERNGNEVEVLFDNGRQMSMNLEYVVRKEMLTIQVAEM